MRREFFFILLISIYPIAGSDATPAETDVSNAADVIRQTPVLTTYANCIITPSELYTTGGISLHSPATPAIFTFRDWGCIGIREHIKVLSLRWQTFLFFLPFDRTDIIFPFHFFP